MKSVSDLILAPLERSSWLGIFWPRYNRGSLWLYNIPEALHGLREGQKRACHQPEFLWAWEDGVLRARMKPGAEDPQARVALECRPDEEGVAMTLRVTNAQESPYLGTAVLDACLRHSSAWRFLDTTGDRTLVRKKGEWVSLRELYGNEALTRARNIAVGGDVDEGIIARQDEDRKRVVAAAWEGAVQVCSNLAGAISCIHSDPGFGGLAAGETAVRHGRLWFGEWDLDELHRRHMQGAGQ